MFGPNNTHICKIGDMKSRYNFESNIIKLSNDLTQDEDHRISVEKIGY